MVDAVDDLIAMVNMGPLIRSLITVVVVFAIFHIILRFTKRRLLKKATTKKQISNIKIFAQTLQYLFIIFLFLFAILSYVGSWSSLGVGIGLISAALGFALQRPITSVAAWIMLVIKRPFDVGDRIIVGTFKGDVDEIALTHVTLKEVGGTIESEDNSGRNVIIPNWIFFEESVINYNQKDEYVLNEIIVSVTYESNLEKAEHICQYAALNVLKKNGIELKKQPVIRVLFAASSIDMKVRFMVPTKEMQRIASAITKKIYTEVKKERDVEFAYPHTEVIYRKK